ncbi:MAG: hypothetical protein EOO99_02700 [Pedobacter sp.]|nr:MAG: hypothetical protein EOO99_02700 [Pedobacter sp.]
MNLIFNLFLSVILTFFSTLIFSQTIPYKFSNQIETYIKENPGGFTLQLAATDYAFQGNLSKALTTWNLQRPNINKISMNVNDSSFYAQSIVKSAKEYIIERSKTEDIVILNELHHNPTHRVFAASLLKDLYANGYRYLGLEALIDSTINDRGFVVQESGFYTAEPEFANFINEALALGFKVFGYEASAEAKWDDDNWRNREIAQAHNIHHYMQTNKEGKYFIYCGAGHAFEGNNNGRGLSMAGILAGLTKINPFTIDQNRYSYKGETRYNHPLSLLIKAQEPVILENKDGKVFNSSSNSYETDISIIQPVSMFEDAENYLIKLDPKRINYRYSLDSLKSFPALIFYHHKKNHNIHKLAVPVGVIEIKSKEDITQLYLKPNDYTVEIRYQ